MPFTCAWYESKFDFKVWWISRASGFKRFPGAIDASHLKELSWIGAGNHWKTTELSQEWAVSSQLCG